MLCLVLGFLSCQALWKKAELITYCFPLLHALSLWELRQRPAVISEPWGVMELHITKESMP